MYSITISQYSCMPSSMDVAARSGSPPPPVQPSIYVLYWHADSTQPMADVEKEEEAVLV